MTGALLYQPRPSWRVGLAFIAAVLIHLAAIAIAGAHRNTLIEAAPGQDDFPIVDISDPALPMEELRPPPEDVAAPSPIPVPIEEQTFREESTTPPPVRRQTPKPIAPIVKVRSGVSSGTVSLSSVRVMAQSGPRPVYPYEARRQRLTGSGLVVMAVDPVSGSVTDVVMQQSTGSPLLDNAAVAAFRRWRFKPGTVSRVRCPITFTMTGAQY